MKQLRQYIRGLLLESCESLNSKLQAGIDVIDTNDLRIFVEKTSDFIEVEVYDNDEEKVAEFSAQTEWGCNDAYTTSGANVESAYKGTGLGAVLYNLALEYAGIVGISADRRSVSHSAYRMWKYFMENPSEYDAHQLDFNKHMEDEGPQAGKEQTFLTDTAYDDCGQESALSHIGLGKYDFDEEEYEDVLIPNPYGATPEMLHPDNWHWYVPEFKGDFLDSPLTKSYTKKNRREIKDCLKHKITEL